MRCVLYDFDGVLAHSLKPHLQFCRDVSKKYGLDLELPHPSTTEKVKVRTYASFLKALGFPPDLVGEILEHYHENFHDNYPVELFHGIEGMLEEIKKKCDYQGIVSLNYEKNIRQVFGDSLDEFDFLSTHDHDEGKVNGINRCLEELDVKKEDVVFIGDTLRDYEAAHKAGVLFIGTTYGWEITPEDEGIVKEHNPENFLVNSPKELRAVLMILSYKYRMNESMR